MNTDIYVDKVTHDPALCSSGPSIRYIQITIGIPTAEGFYSRKDIEVQIEQ